eukprot:c22981_g1_i1 orf=443-2011(-)
MGTGTGNRVLSHQLSNGLYVSGTPDQYKERQPTMSSTVMPYTGGDVKRSGELGKMFDIPVEAPKLKKSSSAVGVATKAGSFRSASSNSGPLNANNPPRSTYSTSGPLNSAGAPWQTSNMPASQSSISGPLTGMGVGGTRQGSHSGPLSRNGDPTGARTGVTGVSLKTSGPLSSTGGTPGVARQNSGSQAPNLPATGLITSGPISSGPLSSSGVPRKHSGPMETGVPGKFVSVGLGSNQGVNNLSHGDEYSLHRNFPRVILWTVIPLFIIGFIAGGFIIGTVQNPILLIVVATLFGAVLLLLTWNVYWGKRAVTGFMASYPNTGLNNAKDGQYVKVTGVVTCGGIPLESSFQRVSRCVYVSTGLYEYRGFGAKPARPKHRTFTWGLRYLERHVVDFYISDFQSGLRALVKAGYGVSVTPYVEESTILDVTKNRELPSNFLRWITERNLSSDDRVMRLKEGYIKEGSTVTVMGVVQRNENVLMIVSPPEPVSTGCQFGKFLLPANLEGIVLKCDDSLKADVVSV